MKNSPQKQILDSKETSKKDIWSYLLESLCTEYGLSVFNTWFVHLTFHTIKNNTISIAVPSKFIREWIITNYFSKIKEIVNQYDSNIKIIDIRVKANRSPKDNNVANDTLTNDNFAINDNKFSSKLDINYSFDNFIIGKSNNMAFAAAQAFATGKKQAVARSVLYLHSSVGMGKTHLLQAIASYIHEHKPHRNVAYLSAEKFMHQFILHSRDKDILTFREKIRSLDALFIDDIQFICGKNKTLQEFANTVNALIEAGKIVVISADKSPYDLELDHRTKSRLAGGIVVNIKSAERKLRYEILQAKAKLLNVNIPDDILEFIAENITSSIRELEGALNKIITHTSLVDLDVTLKNTKEILRDSLQAHSITISISKILEVVANYYGITLDEILSKSRAAKYVYPRQVVAFIAKQNTDISLQEIGRNLGGRDHATIIYSIKKLEEKMADDKSVCSDIAKIMDILSTACY